MQNLTTTTNIKGGLPPLSPQDLVTIRSLASLGLSADAIAHFFKLNVEFIVFLLSEAPKVDFDGKNSVAIDEGLPGLLALTMRRLGKVIESGNNQDAMNAAKLVMQLNEGRVRAKHEAERIALKKSAQRSYDPDRYIFLTPQELEWVY